jgi:hypothetical protein
MSIKTQILNHRGHREHGVTRRKPIRLHQIIEVLSYIESDFVCAIRVFSEVLFLSYESELLYFYTGAGLLTGRV